MDVMDMLRLEEKIALVTGGGRKFGLFLTTGLAEAGAKVIIASRDMNNNRIESERLRNDGLDVNAEYLDIANEQSIIDLKDAIISRYGKIDVLVNSARSAPMLSFDDNIENWEASMKINNTGTFLCTRVFLDQMKKQNFGNIINIASIYGIVGQDPALYDGTDWDSAPDYWVLKGGMINLTRYIATKFARYNIRVNCISPGGLLEDSHPKEFLENYNRRVPLGRMTTGDDVKGAVVYLASEASAYVTGHNLVVDGGWTAW